MKKSWGEQIWNDLTKEDTCYEKSFDSFQTTIKKGEI